MNSKRKRSAAGRQPGAAGERNRQAIIDAARQQFARAGFRATTLRAIADEAGVTPAMIHYHFNNKRGLYFAVVEAVAEPMLRRLGEMRSAPGPDALAAFFDIYMRTIAAHPEMPALLMQDVLASDGDIRSEFAQRFASRAHDIITALLKSGQREGRIDAAMDIDLGMISMLSLAVFPFLAAPLIREVFGLAWNDESLDRLIEQQRSVFLHGITNRSPE